MGGVSSSTWGLMHQILISQHCCTFCSSLAVDVRTRLWYLCWNHEQEGKKGLGARLADVLSLDQQFEKWKKFELLLQPAFFVDILNCETFLTPRAELHQCNLSEFTCIAFIKEVNSLKRSCPLRKGPQTILSSTAPVCFYLAPALFYWYVLVFYLGSWKNNFWLRIDGFPL